MGDVATRLPLRHRPGSFAAKIEQAEKFAASLNKGHVFIPHEIWLAKMVKVAEWKWVVTPDGKEVGADCSFETERKLKELKIPYRIVWEPGSRGRCKGAGLSGQTLV